MYQVVDATSAHVEPIARHMRQDDINELWAAAAILPADALNLSLAAGGPARTWLIDGTPAAMGGINDQGVIWLLGTDLIDRHVRAFLLESRREFEERRRQFQAVFNFIDVRNRRSIRWLRWLGFSMSEPMPYGVFRKPFLHFSWRQTSCV